MSLKHTNPKEYVEFLRKQLNSLTDKNEIVIQYYDELGRKISHVIYKNEDNFMHTKQENKQVFSLFDELI